MRFGSRHTASKDENRLQGINRLSDYDVSIHNRHKMITTEEINLLNEPAIRQLIDDNITRDPHAVALDKHLPHATLIATQIKYLQRAMKKLPSYYAARAIIPHLAFEQSSSEAAAAHKSWRGDTCIDLTCGLGVDAYCLSKGFRKVITIEQNPSLAQAARINFGRLGADNITVVEGRAEGFLDLFAGQGGSADMIYADPDRRGDGGRKLIRLEDCSPDIVALLPALCKISDRIAIKMSPLFDVAEVFRIFGEGCTAEVVSLGGECKEVIADWSGKAVGQTVKASVIGVGDIEFPYRPDSPHHNATAVFTPPYRYMIIPDVALRKARIASAYFTGQMPESHSVSADGYVFSDTLPLSGGSNTHKIIPGKVFEVTYMERFDPKALKKRLKEQCINGLEIYTNDFPIAAPELAHRLGVREGGTAKAAFTRIAGDLWVIGLRNA